MNTFEKMGFEKGKKDAHAYSYQKAPPKSLKNLLLLLLYPDGLKQYKNAYHRGFNQIMSQKKLEKAF